MPFRRVQPCLLLLIISTPALLTTLVTAPLHARAEWFVVFATYESGINPFSAEYLHDALASAEQRGARALIIRLDTPGDLDTSKRLIDKDITSATIPAVMCVSPSSRRGSACHDDGSRYANRRGQSGRKGRGPDGQADEGEGRERSHDLHTPIADQREGNLM